VTRTDSDNANQHERGESDNPLTNSRSDASVGVEDNGPAVNQVEAPEEVIEDEDVDQLAVVMAERDEFLDQLQRSRAEFANFRRRNDQERAMVRQIVGRDVLSQFLPVIDDLDRALAVIPESERQSGWVKGVSLIQSKLNGTVERLGVTKIEALNKPFDPAFHEAVATEPGSSGSFVVEIYQSGYQLGDLLVRPAMVKTGDAPVENQEAGDQETFDA
jgi:molecular chaperone GrpE